MFSISDDDLECAPVVPQSAMNCTVVSIMPFALKERKPQIHPGYFQIPPAKDGKIQCLPIGESIHWMVQPFEKMPPIKIVETSKSIARSIVNDFVESQLAVDADAAPGLFFVEGHYTPDGIRQQYRTRLELAKEMQGRWFVNLVRMADDDWAKVHQHQAISDLQRHAATALGLIDREWLSVALDNMMTRCPLCREMVSPDAIVHATCGYILDLKKYEQMQARVIRKAERLIGNPLEATSGSVSFGPVQDLEFLQKEK